MKRATNTNQFVNRIMILIYSTVPRKGMACNCSDHDHDNHDNHYGLISFALSLSGNLLGTLSLSCSALPSLPPTSYGILSFSALPSWFRSTLTASMSCSALPFWFRSTLTVSLSCSALPSRFRATVFQLCPLDFGQLLWYPRVAQLCPLAFGQPF
jgi:hypothetical protein